MDLVLPPLKLSETYVNLRQSFRDDSTKDKFLKQQSQYRKATEILRTRCIELEPQNPTYYSNLGYSHYQFVRELRLPGGRRDGNPKVEAETAIQLFKKALEINPHRINDNHRLGLLLTETLPKLNLFGKRSVISKELIESVNEKVIEGISAFKSGIESYEVYFSAQPNKQKQYHKDYIKCYYDIARAYSDLIRNDWDESIFLLGLDTNIDVEDRVSFIPIDLEHVDLAIQNLTKCIQIDASNVTQVTDIEGIRSFGLQNGTMEGVFKLYSLGKYYFLKYWILSGYGQRSNSEGDECRGKAEQLLLTALITDWPENKKNADKTFIAERLCRLYISKKEYEKAVEIMKPFIRKRMDYYVRYSLAEAFMLAGKYDEANQQIKLALEDDKGNKEKWLGHFLESV
ncbi:MAG: hypothetical protein IPK08_19675 [Bacteroidetes bacterium]|nr:hypothetical protein [Bacteroidota bacterium]